jgi:hypothetical protein
MPRRATLTIALGALVLAGLPLHALEYEIRLHNGNVFHTRYEPTVAPFDDTKLLFMTVNGNPITLVRTDVKDVISLTEASGFGKRLDAMTVLIGLAPNDNPTPEEQAALEGQAAAGQLPNPYSMPLESETEGTQGMPLYFLNQTTPPLGAAGGAGGSAAAARRGGGGTQFVEPPTRND